MARDSAFNTTKGRGAHGAACVVKLKLKSVATPPTFAVKSVATLSPCNVTLYLGIGAVHFNTSNEVFADIENRMRDSMHSDHVDIEKSEPRQLAAAEVPKSSLTQTTACGLR